jgi:TPR repeat protein
LVVEYINGDKALSYFIEAVKLGNELAQEQLKELENK